MSVPTNASTVALRNVASTLRILQRLQSYGLPFMKYIQHKDQITQTMHYYLTRLGIDITSIPPVIHIAGTKGKGSTAAFTESILRHQGYTTGLYTSPHLIHVTERFRINGQPVQESFYLNAFYTSWDKLNDGITFGKEIFHDDEWKNGSNPSINTTNNPSTFSSSSASTTTLSLPSSPVSSSSPSSSSSSSPPLPHPFASLPPLPGFNFLTLLAFKLFLEAKVDVIILEVGLGGRLDATNIVPKDKVAVCGISTLDYDHVELLGYTIQEIAKEKAGIFKPGVPAVTVNQIKEGLQTLCEIAQQEGTPLFLADPGLVTKRLGSTSLSSLNLGLSGEFQYINASLALALVDIFHHQRQSGRITVTKDKEISTSLLPSSLHPLSSSSSSSTGSRSRSSSFHDHFGSSTVPIVGQYTFPPPVYDNASILSPEIRQGLEHTQWPGRAQIFDIAYESVVLSMQDSTSTDSKSGSSSSNPRITKKGGQFTILKNKNTIASSVSTLSSISTPHPSHKVRLYIDGAHTEKSMQEICKWFYQQQQERKETNDNLPTVKKRYVLLFNCGSDKDVLALLLPLTTLPFTSIHLTPVPWTLTTRSTLPTVDTALGLYIDRRRKMKDSIAINEIETIAKQYNITLPTLEHTNSTMNDTPATNTVETKSVAPVTSTEPLAWQKGLRQLWIEIQQRTEFQPIRNRLRTIIGGDSDALRKVERILLPKGGTESSSSASPIVHGHHLDALDTIYQEHIDTVKELNKDTHIPVTVETHVLVTGSLYLVGNVLEGIGYYPS